MKPPTPSATEHDISLGARLALAIAAKDGEQLRALFSTPVTFRAVTPRRFWDADTAVGVEHLVLGTWFGAGTTIRGVDVLASDTVGDVEKVSYRLSVDRPEGPAVVEQVAFYSVADDRIVDLRVVCSGFRPTG